MSSKPKMPIDVRPSPGPHAPKVTAATALLLAVRYRNQRQTRLDAQHAVDDLEAAEKATRAEFVAQLKTLGVGSVGGNGRYLGFEEENEPTVESWPELYAHIQATGEFDLLNKALNAKAVKLRWEEDKGVPGVGYFPVEKFFDRKS